MVPCLVLVLYVFLKKWQAKRGRGLNPLLSPTPTSPRGLRRGGAGLGSGDTLRLRSGQTHLTPIP